MVGILLDGCDSSPGAQAFAADIARVLAGDNAPAHLFFLIPTPFNAPRIEHVVVRPDRPAARIERDRVAAAVPTMPASQLETCVAALGEQLSQLVSQHQVQVLHALGLAIAAPVARRVSQLTSVPYFVTPRGSDLSPTGTRSEAHRKAVDAALLDARAVLALDAETAQTLEQRFTTTERQPHLHVLERGVALSGFLPLAHRERATVAHDGFTRAAVTAPLEGVDWDHSFVIITVEPRGDRHGLEQLLFAVPELLLHEPRLQVIVVRSGEAQPLTDGLRAALAAKRPELLHDVVSSSELCQPLVSHLERLHREGRTAVWWENAARLEPERIVRFVGPLSRPEFATLLRLADVFVVPGQSARPPSQMFYEALACGVMPVASELCGIAPLAGRIATLSQEIANLCVVRAGGEPVHELEDKLGRIVRLRPELADWLRGLATREFDAQRLATDLHSLYQRPVPALATPL